MTRKGPTLPFTIDWEDWFQLCCPPFDDPGALGRFEDRLERATEATLAFCEERGARATWFCLADQARRHPHLLRRIVGAGHTIGLHGLTHRRAFEMEAATWRASLAEARKVLEDLSGSALRSYRAPEWSLRGEAEGWWRHLPELGFDLDSSRAPLKVLGDPHWPRTVHRLGAGLLEFPPPVAGPPWLAVPLWGWALRLLPESWMRARLQGLAASGAGTPVVLHPWELDPGQPPLPSGTPLGHRFAHAAGLRSYGLRLTEILSGLNLVPLESWGGEGHGVSEL
ncbi:MAG: DUF3473 domain-containing protein [Acidobacteria bacterium]|nr:DUF3473 domain-containing protein [Acidobacteriota bacterium]